MRARRVRIAKAVGWWFFFLLLPFAVLWRFAPLASKTTIGNDYVLYPLDAQLEYVWGWKRGVFPLFVPGFAGGTTASAMTLGQAWHPMTWLCAFIPQYATGRAEPVVTVLRFLEIGATHAVVYRATRASGLRAASSFLLTFVVVYNARMLDSLRYGPSIDGYCGMLLLCAAFAHAFREGWTLRRVSVGAIAVYLTLVSGHPQWAMFGATGAGLFALGLPLVGSQLASPPVRGDRAIRYVLGVGITSALGSALSAVYVLPFLREFMAQNDERVGQNYSFTLGWGDTVRGTLSNFFRPLESDVHGAFGGNVLFLALVLSVPVVLATRKRGALGILLPTFILAVALLFSMGKATPVHHFMVEHLPLFSSFRTPGRANLWIPPMILLIGWVVLADFERADVARSWMRAPAIAVGGALAFMSLLIFQRLVGTTRSGDTVALAVTTVPHWVSVELLVLFGVAAAMLGVLAIRVERTRRTAWLIAIATTMWAAALALPYGTWTTKRVPNRTIAAIDAHHQKRLRFWGDPGFGMEPKLVAAAKTAKIPYERPLASVVEKASWVGAGDAILAVKKGLPAGEIVLTGDETPVPSGGGEGPDTAATVLVNWNRWEFDARAPRGGVFVFGQPALPQWRAWVDGRPAPIFTANAVDAAVLLQPGEHHVEFRFVSRATEVGAAIFFAGFIALAVANGWHERRRAATKRAQLAWTFGTALVVVMFLAGGVSWYRCLYPSVNIAAPAKN